MIPSSPAPRARPRRAAGAPGLGEPSAPRHVRSAAPGDTLHRGLLLALVLLGLALGSTGGAWGQQDEPRTVVDVLPIEGTIDPPVAAAITDLLASADERGSDLVILQLDSRGGLAVDEAELLRTVEAAGTPVVVYVGPALARAEGRGLAGLLALAADVAVLAPDATFGPLLPVDLADDTPAQDRRLLTDLAQRTGLSPATAPAVVDGLGSDAMDADQALAAGVIAVQANGIDGLLTDLDGATLPDGRTLTLAAEATTLNLHSLGLVRRTLHASATPIFIYLMLVIGLALLLFEAFQPGFGVAGIAAIVVLVFAVYGVVALPVAWWAVVAIAGGLALLAADVAIAGLGVPTVVGTIGLGVGSMFLYPSPHLGVPGWLIGTMMVAALVFFVVVLTIVLRAQAGPDTVGLEELVGRQGIVRSALNPEGHVFLDGALWRARWTDELDGKVPVGTLVRVHGVDGAVVLVEAAHGSEGEPVAAGSAGDV